MDSNHHFLAFKRPLSPRSNKNAQSYHRTICVQPSPYNSLLCDLEHLKPLYSKGSRCYDFY